MVSSSGLQSYVEREGKYLQRNRDDISVSHGNQNFDKMDIKIQRDISRFTFFNAFYCFIHHDNNYKSRMCHYTISIMYFFSLRGLSSNHRL